MLCTTVSPNTIKVLKAFGIDSSVIEKTKQLVKFELIMTRLNINHAYILPGLEMQTNLYQSIGLMSTNEIDSEYLKMC